MKVNAACHVVLAMAVLFGTACSRSPEGEQGQTQPEQPSSASKAQAPAKTGEASSIMVYSGRAEKLVGPALEAFERASGIDVRVKYADTAQLGATLLEEGAKSPADVFIAQDASTLGYLEQQGLFVPVPDQLLNKVPKTFRSASGQWVGITGRARVLAYNTGKLKTASLPKNIRELTQPAWRGRVGWAPENASFQSFVAAMIQLEGEQATKTWLQQMKANEPRDYPKNTPAVMAVSRGEIDVALVNHYYVYRLRDEHGADFPADNHYFKSNDAASLVNLSGVGILKTSKKQDAAGKLVDFMLSEAGQKLFVEKNHEFPVVSGVASPDGLPAIETLKAPQVDLAEMRNLEATVGLLKATGVLH